LSEIGLAHTQKDRSMIAIRLAFINLRREECSRKNLWDQFCAARRRRYPIDIVSQPAIEHEDKLGQRKMSSFRFGDAMGSPVRFYRRTPTIRAIFFDRCHKRTPARCRSSAESAKIPWATGYWEITHIQNRLG
jgi:hypothetical protein